MNAKLNFTSSHHKNSTRCGTTITNMEEPRTSGKHLTDIDIAKILGLAKAELPQREIASLMGCSQKAIQHNLETYQFETFQGHDPRREYKRKTTAREDRYIKHILNQNKFLPLRDITNIVSQKIIPISKTTLSRRRSEADLESRIAAQKPALHKENIVKRLEWALKHKDWTIEQ